MGTKSPINCEYFQPLEVCELKPVETDIKKLKKVLHYVINQVGSRANVGKTVLFKLLYFCDFNFYLETEKYLTGENYRKIDHGPAPIHFDKVVKELIQEEKIAKVDGKYFGRNQYKLASLKEPDLKGLSATEIKFIDDTLNEYAHLNAKQIEKLSHKDTPWKATPNKDLIDYNLVFYRDDLLDEDEKDDC